MHIHDKGKHPKAFPVRDMSILDKGFTVLSVVKAAPNSSEANMDTEKAARPEIMGSLILQPLPIQIEDVLVASVERGVQ